MVAALNLAEQGYKVYLIEKSGELGLRMYDNFLKMAGVEG